MAFLIDTCIWIDIERGVLAPLDVAQVSGDEPVYISPVSIAELRFGAEITSNPALRQRRLVALSRLERRPLIPIDGGTGTVFGTLAAALRAAGREHRYRVQDLWLASQALQHSFTFLTRNRTDFEHIPGLDLAVI